MIFLPIAERELRVASRKRATFWLRLVSALIGLVIGGGLLMLHLLGGIRSSSLGLGLFSTLTWMSFCAAISAGVFFTSDSVCEEKRAGTLGFLFLTDLRGYDVIFGKLAATSLRVAFALLALLPILGLTLLMGGVTGWQFWRTCLALGGALLCSLAAGLFVSTISRESHKAVSGTVLLLIALLAFGPLADFVLRHTLRDAGPIALSWTSPGYAFVRADIGGPQFWNALIGSGVVAVVLFLLASLLVRRTWQEKRASHSANHERAFTRRYGLAPVRMELRRKLMDRNPFLWLASRDRWQAAGVWVLAAIGITAFCVLLLTQLPASAWVAWNLIGTLLVVLLYVWTASQAPRFFVEARRNGLFELMLAAPIKDKDIVHGQWLSLLRALGPPTLLLILTQAGGAAFATYATWGSMASQAGIWGTQALIGMVSGVGSGLAILGNLIALIWFGMWMGMKSKSINTAAFKTILFVQVIPWFVISFLSSIGTMLLVIPGIVTPGAMTSQNKFAVLFPLFMVAVPISLTITKDVIFFFWARNRLYSRFREEAARSLDVPRLPLVSSLPPVIAARPAIKATA